MNTLEYIKERFDQLQASPSDASLNGFRSVAYGAFNKMGIPSAKHEEWKYTRIGNVFSKDYQLSFNKPSSLTRLDVDHVRLPGHESANELVFVNGIFSSSLSVVRSAELVIMPLEEAAKGEYASIVTKHFGHSSHYAKDGINAMNTALSDGGIFIFVKPGKITQHPVYVYNIADARTYNVLSQPRSLVYISENAHLELAETYVTLGKGESFTNQVMEIVVNENARLEYYKIQNDASHTSQVSTTHIRQAGKSYTHAVTISLNGAIVRNNLNVVLEAPYCESHLYGLYFQRGQSHIDNHTVVDNAEPNCLSNELYKGIMDGSSTGVFNGKIYVRQKAQKTNAFQSNKNILLSGLASVNTKPQLEIFADDVKCSHGCTIGRLNEEGMFYLRSRGIEESMARSLLLNAFAIDILDHIKLTPLRSYVDQLLEERLQLNNA